MRTLISLKDIEKSFGTQTIIDHLSLDVMEGEFLTLLGPSGCGKTTLLRMINGFEIPDSGSVTLDGKNLLAVPPNKREVNTVFQSYALFPHLTVRENIAFPLRMKKEALQLIMRHQTGKQDWDFSPQMLEATCVMKLEVEKLSCKVHE